MIPSTTMAIRQDILDMLVCLVCRTPLEVVRNGEGLKCAKCRRVYPVRDDIPQMLESEARVED